MSDDNDKSPPPIDALPDDSSSSSSSSEEENEDSEQIRDKLLEFKNKLADNPFDYETHVQLIAFARANGELDEVRSAREEMSRRFPLSSKLWLDWITDEKNFSGTDDDNKQVIMQLFERAVQDYACVDVWVQYSQFMMSSMSTEQNISDLRQVIERGLVAVGLDASRGNLLWELYRELETALTSMVQGEEEKRNCIRRIFEIYRRQLSVPLLNMEITYAEFQEWLKEIDGLYDANDATQVKNQYEKALKELQKMLPFENSLISSDGSHAEDFKKYAEFAESNFTPAAAQSIYERAVTAMPVDQSLWISYVNYLDRKVKIDELSFKAYERATRNCPWSSAIWCKYILSKERYGQGVDAVLPIFEKSLTAGLPAGPDFREVWTTYLDFLRRHTNFEVEQEVDTLRRTFNSAADHLAAIEGADPSFSVLQYLSRVEVIFCKSIANAREIWNNMMSVPHLSSQSQLWMEFFHLEYAHGDKEEAKKILQKGFQNARDWPESLGQLMLRIEREEGTSLESYEKTFLKYNQIMKKVNDRRLKEKDSSKSKVASKEKAPEKGTNAKASDRKRKMDGKDGDSAFKAPLAVDAAPSKRKKTTDDTTSQTPTPHYVKQNDSKSDTDDLLTVFVSNLDFSVDDDKLRAVFSQFGEIADIRLVRNYKGLSKGFAYIQFSTIQAVRKALANDRMKMEEGGRPVFISEMGKRKDFKFTNSLEKHKLFVSDLHPEVDEAMLRSVFEKYGQLKDIRIVTYRNGHSKGRAYVEFDDELGAQNGLQANGLLLKDRNISVAISNPQQAKITAVAPSLGSAVSGGRGMAGYLPVQNPLNLNRLITFSFCRRQRIAVPMIPTSVMRRMPHRNGSH